MCKSRNQRTRGRAVIHHLFPSVLLVLAGALLAAVPATATDRDEDGGSATEGSSSVIADSPAFSGRLVFYDDGSQDVFRMDFLGGPPWRLTDDDAREVGLQWSPFGSRVAFAADGIWVMGADGSDPYQLTNSGDRDAALAWSPDGSKIAFSRYPGDCFVEMTLCSSEVWVIDADGSNQRKLAGSESLHAWGPAWSPDGTQIAFTRGDIDCWADCGRDVWVMKADGSNQRNLGSPDRSESGAVWSPDGSQIAFTSRSSTGTDDIFVMNADGSNPVNLTPDADHQFLPAWSPDGSMIAFEEEAAGLGCMTCPSDLGVMNSDGTGRTKITDDFAFISGPTWTPDGSWISFWSKRGTGTDVWMVSPTGRDLTQVTTTGAVYSFAWEPVDFGRFGDTQLGHLFHRNVEWLAAAGITKGCNPPVNTLFCPSAYVTRGQMAAFLVRACV